jgi:hypothetical protein
VRVCLVPADRYRCTTVRSAKKGKVCEPLFGILFIRAKRVLLGVLSLDLFAVLLGGVTALLPIYARDILGTCPWASGSCARRPPSARW